MANSKLVIKQQISMLKNCSLYTLLKRRRIEIRKNHKKAMLTTLTLTFRLR